MKNITVAKIAINNPILTSYIKKIQTWDSTGNLCNKIITEKQDDVCFYGVYYDEHFLAASTMDYDSSNDYIDINLINGSIQHYEEIEEESMKQLVKIAKMKYGKEKIRFNCAKA